MSTEPQVNNVSNEEEMNSVPNQESQELNSEEVLQTRVDKDAVIGFIEGMVQAMGNVACGNIPQQQHPRNINKQQSCKYQSKQVANIMQKLERLQKYPDLADEVMNDPGVIEWVERTGCKQREYYEELECAQELTGFYGGYRNFPMAIKAAAKARNITLLHHRDDEEALSELNWVLADLHAASDKMEQAMDYLRQTMELLEPGWTTEHPTYKELLQQLQETNQKSRMVLTSA
ncbi:MAG: hypothetical protein K2Z81_11920 [Cyanobacteria bacterium]|nr:hypothetical protein [Cyanobacteriota bacterium]